MEKRPTRSVSHKGEKVCSYTVDFKLEVVNYAEQSSIHAAGRKYNVSRSSVRDWKKKKVQLEDLKRSSGSGAHRRRLSGGGRKVFDSSTERSLIEWINERKQQGLTISGALIIKKAKSLQQEKLERQQQQQQLEQLEQQQQPQQQEQHQELKEEGDDTNGEEQEQPHTPETSPSQKKTTSNKLTYSRGWLEKFMNRNGLTLKNFPTYKSPMTSLEDTKIEMNEHMPTVIPLDDLLPGDIPDNGSFTSKEITDDESYTTSKIIEEKPYTTRELREDASFTRRELRDEAYFTTRDREMSVDRLFTTRDIHDDVGYTPREIRNNRSFMTRERRDDGSLHGTPSDTHSTQRDNRERESTPLDRTIDELHERRSSTVPSEIRKFSNIRKSRPTLIETPSRKSYETIRHIHSPSVMSIEEPYTRSIPPHKLIKNEADDTYSHTSSSTMYPKPRLDNRYPYTQPITTYHLTRVGDTYLRHTVPCSTFYKPRTETTRPCVSNTSTYHKTRGESTYSYSSPNTTLHKPRSHHSCTTTHKTYHNSPSDESFTYTTSNATYIKTRIDGSPYTYTSTDAFHKSRDMQNPIVIPLDDILPE